MNKQMRLLMMPVTALLVTSCASEGKLDVRPVGRQATAEQPVSMRIALAHGHLAVGNVALALEEFRRASREENGNALAFAGMAECYRLMGRTDLSKRYYEQALALAPTEPGLYVGLSNALADAGDIGGASAARGEAAARVEGKVVVPAAAIAATEPALAAASRPPAAPTAVTFAQPPLRSNSVTVALAPARPMASNARLERLSSGEVALVTSAKSLWAARAVATTPRSVTVKFDQRPAMVVLNAARVQGIAARTRDYLAARGFAATRIGDAPRTSVQTVIRYPSEARSRATRIAAQFPFAPRLEQGDGPLTLIVGRDAASNRRDRTG